MNANSKPGIFANMKVLFSLAFGLMSILSYAQCDQQPQVITNDPDCNQNNGTITVTSPTDQTGNTYNELFISEVTDHTSGTHSYVELYNGTDNIIDLSNYEVLVFNNGNTTANCNEPLNGILGQGETAIINLTTVVEPDPTITSDILLPCSGINNDDRIALANNGTIIDEFGYSDGTDLITLEHFTYRRKNDVTAPSTTFDENDWDFQDWSTSPVDYSNMGTFDAPAQTLYTYALLNDPAQAGSFSTDTDFDALSPGDYYIAYRAYDVSIDPANLICETSEANLINWGPITLTFDPQPVIPTFDAVPPQCAGSNIDPLPTTSNNGISGSWSPAIDNTQTTTYTFSPDSDECAENTTLEIVINDPVTPTFDAVPPQCAGSNIDPLPTTSNNGISGSWSPAIDNTQTTTYTFTPDTDECAETTTLEIVINDPVTPTFDEVPQQSQGSNIQPLPTTSNNGISGSWSPAIDNTQTMTYTFTPDSDECAEEVSLTIIIQEDFVLPEGLSPNGDGRNDNMDLAVLDDRTGIASFTVFDRYGSEVYQRKNYRDQFTGQSNNGNRLKTGTYFYIIKFKTEDSEFGRTHKDWFYIHRER